MGAILRRLVGSPLWGRTPLERRFGLGLVLVTAALLAFVSATGREWRDARADRVAKVEARFADEGREFADEDARTIAIFKQIKIDHWVRTGLWWGGVGLAGVAVGLLATRRWWVGGGAAEASRPLPASVSAGSRRDRIAFGLGVFAIVVVAAFLRAPRLGLSLYNDEAYTVRHYVMGEFRPSKEPDGELVFRTPPWAETVWENQAGNNAMLFSVLARLSHEAWQAASGAVDGRIGEAAFRAPSVVGGLLSIVVIASMARHGAGPVAGLTAALVAALHPWHVRYSSEGRGYGLALALVPLAAHLLVLALERDRWRWWFAFAIVQVLAVAAFPGAGFAFLAVDGSVLAWLGWRALGRGDRAARSRGARFLAANLMSAGVFVAVALPWIAQMRVALRYVSGFDGRIRGEWWLDQVGFFAVGLPWFDANPGFPGDPSVSAAGAVPRAVMFAWGIVMVVGIAAAVWRFRRSPAPGCPPLALVWGAGAASGILAGLVMQGIGGYLFSWYTIPALPFVILLVAVGWGRSRVPSRGGEEPGATVPVPGRAWLAALGIPAAFACACFFPSVLALRHLPKERVREVVETMRGGAVFDAYDQSAAITAGAWTDARVYDPHLVVLGSPEDLDALVQRVHEDRSGSTPPLWVTFSRRPLVAGGMPWLLERLESPGGEFERVAILHGFGEPQYDHHVYRLRSGGQAGTGRAAGGPGARR